MFCKRGIVMNHCTFSTTIPYSIPKAFRKALEKPSTLELEAFTVHNIHMLKKAQNRFSQLLLP